MKDVEEELLTDTPSGGPFELTSQRLGALPVINAFCDRIGLDAVLGRWLGDPDPRHKLAPAVVIRLLVANLLVGRTPLYGLAEWATGHDLGLLGLDDDADAGLLNDDRLGRALIALFDADRASMLTELIIKVITEFGIDVSQLHNDSTSVSVHGDYTSADGRERRGKPTPALTLGHSKDHRPDLKQLVWILTVAADGSVPIAYRLADGNTSDDPTHIPTWDGLAAALGRTDFLYIADSKLCTSEAMRHIASRGGRFVTVMPRTRAEDKWFRNWITSNTPAWAETIRLPGSRQGEADRVWSVFSSPRASAEGYRITWVHSTTKAAADTHARNTRIEAGISAIEDLNTRLAGPKTRFKTHAAVAGALEKALTRTRAARWLEVRIEETVEETFRQEKNGRPGPATRYRRITRTRYHLTWHTREEIIGRDAASDGCFPLITNDPGLTGAEVLAAYRYQPNLERRHHLLKTIQQADPVWLRDPARIEAIFCCQFLALLLAALIERHIRQAMRDAEITGIPLYPELRDCGAPSTERIFTVLADLTRHQLHDHNHHLIQVFQPQLTPLQTQILDLLDIPTSTYTPTT